MNDTKTPLHPPSFPLLESLDNGRTWTEVWFMGASPLATVFAFGQITCVEITDAYGDARSYRRVTR